MFPVFHSRNNNHRTLQRRLHVELLEDRLVPSGFWVTNSDDSGAGSLRQAITDANSPAFPGQDIIKFRPNLSGTIALTSGELKITDDLIVQGRGAHRLTISGEELSRVFNIASDTDVTISGLKITNGFANGDAVDVPSAGGGILSQGNLTLKRVVLSDNVAEGTDGTLVPTPAALLGGGAIGGAVASFGELIVHGSAFKDNLAKGASDVTLDNGGFFTGEPSFPGTAFGGAIVNYGSGTITRTHFVDNRAEAGDRGVGDFATIASGGAIYNDADLTIARSSFYYNQAIGGDEGESVFHNGHALGGAILSGSLVPGAVAELVVRHSTFTDNQALGGNDNTVLDPVPLADGPNNAYGGAIVVFQGIAAVDHSYVARNTAIAGNGGAEDNGSLAAGGGIFFFSFIGGVTGSVTNSTIVHNSALGGSGVVGGGDGGIGLGGGVAVGSLGAAFGAPALSSTTIRNTLFAHNRAEGGDGVLGGNGGDALGAGLFVGDGSTTVSYSSFLRNRAEGGDGVIGGNGQGGGIYNGADGEIRLTRSFILFNRAKGGDGSTSDGLGQGGGIFNANDGSSFEIDPFSYFWTILNSASDHGNNIFGMVTII